MKFQRKNSSEIQISEVEVMQLTNNMVDAHHDTLPMLQASISEWDTAPSVESSSFGVSEKVAGMFSRRTFLARTGVLAAGGLVLASTGAGASTIAKSKLGASRGAALSSNASASIDVQIAALAASLENLAVSTYAAALSAAKAGKLGTVPAAIGTFVTTAMAQHKDHAAAWNALVSSAGYKPMTEPNAAIGKVVNTAFAKVTDIAGVAKLALTLEDAAAATYLEAVGVVSSKKGIQTAASIQPVEMQHAAILNFVLGQYPVPSAYATTSGAATLKDLSGLTKKAS